MADLGSQDKRTGVMRDTNTSENQSLAPEREHSAGPSPAQNTDTTAKRKSLNPDTTNPRHLKLQSQSAALEAQIASTRAKLVSTLSRLYAISSSSSCNSPGLDVSTDANNYELDQDTLAQARTIVRNHIALLQRYNEMKDIGSGLMGLIAEKDGRRLGDVMRDFDIEEDD